MGVFSRSSKTGKLKSQRASQRQGILLGEWDGEFLSTESRYMAEEGPETGTSRGRRRSASTAVGSGHIGRGMTGREADKGEVETVVCSSVNSNNIPKRALSEF